MKYPIVNAFKINRLGGSFFPLSVKVNQIENISSIFICAQSVVNLYDLVAEHAKSHLVLFGVGQTSIFEPDSDNPMSLKGLAAEAHIPFSAIDSGCIVLPKVSLWPLLTTFDHYNLNLFDIDSNWAENQVISQVLAYQENEPQEASSFLQTLPDSQFFLTSHDDCYLTIESFHPEVCKEVFIRTLQLYAGAYLESRINDECSLPTIPPDLINSFWQAHFGLTILEQNTELTKGLLKIGLSLKPYNFADSMDYPPELWLVYDIENQAWRR